MLDPKKRDGLHGADAQFLEIIDQYGWHVMSVAPRAESKDKQEWFSYSTGIFMQFSHPEILLCGLGADTAIRIINEIGNALKNGRRFDLDTDCDDILADNVKCRFRRVHISRYKDYVGWSLWFYEGDDFPLWQCFWPDRDGHYPWKKSCDVEVAELQPFLFESSEPIN